MLPAVEGALRHSNGFKTVAATLHESAQNARVECEQSHRDPAGTCGCHGDDFMAEGSYVLLDRLDRVMKDEFKRQDAGTCGLWPAH